MNTLIRHCAVASLLTLVCGVQPLAAQDSLAAARDLYASAQYEEALRILDGIAATDTARDPLTVDLYRTLCFLAVGRSDDADRTIEAIIARDPLFEPGDELPPRTRIAFSDARKRLLPTILQQQYGEAKNAFDRKEFEQAAAMFKRVLDALHNPGLVELTSQPPLTDLRTLAAGFHDLSLKAIPPPPPPPPPAPVEPPAPVNVPPRIYTGEEAGVRPPVTVAQDMPRYPGAVPPTGIRGVVEVVIDENGVVESAVMAVPVNASYDRLVLNAAKKWQFSPAMHEGKPVKYRKRIQINVAVPR
jgi:TonB family protein